MLAFITKRDFTERLSETFIQHKKYGVETPYLQIHKNEIFEIYWCQHEMYVVEYCGNIYKLSIMKVIFDRIMVKTNYWFITGDDCKQT